jgi:hypothetical protein
MWLSNFAHFLYFIVFPYFRDLEDTGTWGKIISSKGFGMTEEDFQVQARMDLEGEAIQQLL